MCFIHSAVFVFFLFISFNPLTYFFPLSLAALLPVSNNCCVTIYAVESIELCFPQIDVDSEYFLIQRHYRKLFCNEFGRNILLNNNLVFTLFFHVKRAVHVEMAVEAEMTVKDVALLLS